MRPAYVALHEVMWHGAWLYGVQRMRRDSSSFSRGINHLTTEKRCKCCIVNNNFSPLWISSFVGSFCSSDHQILFSRLNSVFGIQSAALQWFQSYLSDRYQSTSVNNSFSSPSQPCTSGFSTGARSFRPVHCTPL